MLDNFNWMRLLEYTIQKGFNIALGFIGLKLVLFDSDISTYQGVIITIAGCILISIAAIIEFLVWKQRLIHTTKHEDIRFLLQKGPGELQEIAKYLRAIHNG